MTAAFEALAWPEERAGEALEALATRSRLATGGTVGAAPATPAGGWTDEGLGEWLAAAAGRCGLELVETPLLFGDLVRFLAGCGPALVRLGRGRGSVLAVLGRTGRWLLLLAPDLSLRRVPAAEVAAALRWEEEAGAGPAVDRLLDAASVPARRRAGARAAVLSRRLGARPVSVAWTLRLAPGSAFVRQVRCAGLLRPLATFVLAWAAQYALWIGSWWLIGRGALAGRLDPGWVWAWALLLLTLVPVRLLAGWSQATVAIGLGGLLKMRLLQGAVRLDPAETRHLGSGQLLGRVLDCETVEAMALNGGFLAMVSAVELGLAGLVLTAGPAGALQVGLLGVWVAGALLLAGRAYRRWQGATAVRLDLTHDLVESMVGHRTRAAQLPPERWHDGEDRGLERYLERGARFDVAARDLAVAVPRGWLVLGLLGLAPAFVAGAVSPAAVAVSLGGILLAEGALARLVGSLWSLSGAAVAWRNASLLFHAASRPEIPGRPELAGDGSRGGPILAAERLAFRYRERGEPVLADCSLRLEEGDRVLLQGASGAGKSTLASILTGLRQPESGLLLLGGMDRHTVGSQQWRRRVVAAPQFHENHVFTGSIAFNLLVGRRWPPRAEDLRDAEALCRELGLGELLERMPGGLWQVVGETGWQLSHGERSRLYVARALLQDADVVVLDESFAALDPETLRQALPCVLDRARTLLMIAHP